MARGRDATNLPRNGAFTSTSCARGPTSAPLSIAIATRAYAIGALLMLHKAIPAAHYMIAVFGGPNVRCTAYAPYGTKELSDLAVAGLEGRNGVLLGNHGMIATGATLTEAMWRANELETLAKMYYLTLAAGQPVILSDDEIRISACRMPTCLTELTADLAIGLFQASVLLVSFVGVLWLLSDQVVFLIRGRSVVIPGYMVWCALIYAVAGSIAWSVRRPLIRARATRCPRGRSPVRHTGEVAKKTREPRQSRSKATNRRGRHSSTPRRSC